MFPVPSAFELSSKHIHTRPRGEGQGESEWLSKNRAGLNQKDLQDALAEIPIDADSNSTKKSEIESPSYCSRRRETCESPGSGEKQQDNIRNSDKRRGSLLQCLEHCDSCGSSFTTSSPMPKRKISDYFTATPRPK